MCFHLHVLRQHILNFRSCAKSKPTAKAQKSNKRKSARVRRSRVNDIGLVSVTRRKTRKHSNRLINRQSCYHHVYIKMTICKLAVKLFCCDILLQGTVTRAMHVYLVKCYLNKVYILPCLRQSEEQFSIQLSFSLKCLSKCFKMYEKKDRKQQLIRITLKRSKIYVR